MTPCMKIAQKISSHNLASESFPYIYRNNIICILAVDTFWVIFITLKCNTILSRHEEPLALAALRDPHFQISLLFDFSSSGGIQ